MAGGEMNMLLKEPGITKVLLRNQVLIETSTDDAVFTLKK